MYGLSSGVSRGNTQIDRLRKPPDKHLMYLLSHCVWARKHYAFSEFPWAPVSKRG